MSTFALQIAVQAFSLGIVGSNSNASAVISASINLIQTLLCYVSRLGGIRVSGRIRERIDVAADGFTKTLREAEHL